MHHFQSSPIGDQPKDAHARGMDVRTHTLPWRNAKLHRYWLPIDNQICELSADCSKGQRNNDGTSRWMTEMNYEVKRPSRTCHTIRIIYRAYLWKRKDSIHEEDLWITVDTWEVASLLNEWCGELLNTRRENRGNIDWYCCMRFWNVWWSECSI